jgi:hypothetical protein
MSVSVGNESRQCKSSSSFVIVSFCKGRSFGLSPVLSSFSGLSLQRAPLLSSLSPSSVYDAFNNKEDFLVIELESIKVDAIVQEELSRIALLSFDLSSFLCVSSCYV